MTILIITYNRAWAGFRCRLCK